MKQVDGLSIGEVAERVGIRASAIRFYERAGLLEAPPRNNGQRRYDAAVVAKIRLIQTAQQAGFTVGEIRALFYEFPVDMPPSARWQQMATHKLAEIDVMLARITSMKTLLERALRCECPSLDDCAAGLDTPESQ